MKKKIWAAVFVMFNGFCLSSLNAAVYNGKVFDSLTGKTLPYTLISTKSGQTVQTDSQGLFTLDTLEKEILISRPGYESIRMVLSQPYHAIALRSKDVYEMETMEIKADRAEETIEISKHELSKDVIKQVTATLIPDVAKVVQLLPGVAASNEFSSLLYVRGGDSNEVVAVLDDMIILSPYIWGGLISVFNPNLVEDVQFSSGGFSAENVQAMSAVLDVKNKEGDPEKFKGFVDLSAATLDLFLEGPCLGPEGSSFLFGVRRTHYDLLIPLFAEDNSVYPFFYDGQFKWTMPFEQGKLRMNAIFSLEGMDFLLKSDDEYGSPFGDRNFYYVSKSMNASISYEHWFADDLSALTLFGAYLNDGEFSLASSLTPVEVNRDQSILQIRHIWKWAVNQQHKLKAGLFFFPGTGQATVAVTRLTPTVNGFYEDTISEQNKYDWSSFAGLFVQDDMELISDFLYVKPSMNAQYYSINNQWAVDPRVSFKIRPLENWSLYCATGLYSQYPLDADLLDKDQGNPSLKAEQAFHYIVGSQVDLAQDFFVQLETYYKDYRNLIIRDPQENYTNNGIGKAYGVDLIIQKKLGGQWDGWLTYSYVSSERKLLARHFPDPGEPESNTPVKTWNKASSERPHIFNLILNYNISKDWKLALTQKVHAGKPYTPITGSQGSFDYNGKTYYVAEEGDHNSERYPTYMTTDLKLTLPFWGLKNWSAYIQVSNLFDAKNVDSYQYKQDYSGKREITQLPRMFFGGIKYEF